MRDNIPRFLFVLSLLLPIFAKQAPVVEVDHTQCGKPNQGCVTQKNWDQCVKILASGCQKIAKTETCPTQFACGDDERQKEACASLYHFESRSCEGEPTNVIQVPTWTRAGSQCVHDDDMPEHSVKDQYCDLDRERPIFIEDLYWGSTECKVPWYRFDSPMHAVFTTNFCLDGFKLKTCELGPCPDKETEEYVPDKEETEVEAPSAEPATTEQEDDTAETPVPDGETTTTETTTAEEENIEEQTPEHPVEEVSTTEEIKEDPSADDSEETVGSDEL